MVDVFLFILCLWFLLVFFEDIVDFRDFFEEKEELKFFELVIIWFDLWVFEEEEEDDDDDFDFSVNVVDLFFGNVKFMYVFSSVLLFLSSSLLFFELDLLLIWDDFFEFFCWVFVVILLLDWFFILRWRLIFDFFLFGMYVGGGIFFVEFEVFDFLIFMLLLIIFKEFSELFLENVMGVFFTSYIFIEFNESLVWKNIELSFLVIGLLYEVLVILVLLMFRELILEGISVVTFNLLGIFDFLFYELVFVFFCLFVVVMFEVFWGWNLVFAFLVVRFMLSFFDILVLGEVFFLGMVDWMRLDRRFLFLLL